ncbi:endonuclease III domain-containing protein [Halarchaeum acidiphilum]|nr:endonuclease III [Halarchaeum acidiphilum]
MSDDEPARNISGGESGGGAASAFAANDESDAPLVERVVDRLGDRYWQKTYGGQDAFECLVRTVLSQNTSDKASQPAHDALMARYGPASREDFELERASDERRDPRAGEGDLAVALADAHRPDLAETISSAGLYNRKSETIIRLAERVRDEYGSADGFDAFVTDEDPDTVRDSLLDMKGVGPKTADCVLLFAGGRDGVFPVDTHVHRIARRMGFAPPDADHEAVREAIESELPDEKCGFGHTATIQFGRDFCKSRTPACLDDPEACPMADLCAQVGVYPDTGEVVDPDDAAD